MEPSVSGVGVIDKAMRVISALEVGPLTLAGMVERSGLPRATCHRLAVALEEHGMVRRDGEGRFCHALRDHTGESVQLYVRDGERRVCVLSLESPAELRTIVPEGAALPLDRGSAGRVLSGPDGEDAEPWLASVAEREAGVASVSAPIRDGSGTVLAALSVSGPIERLGRDPGGRFGPAVAEHARALERALG
jgi:DNA-binding IclR family transcriptional regulator